MKALIAVVGVVFLVLMMPTAGVTVATSKTATTITTTKTATMESTQTPEEAYVAAEYLLSHSNPEVGLIYESEDAGKHWLGMGEMPEYSWNYQQTYWAYSDNFYASLALEPFNTMTAKTIAEKISEIPNQGQFLVVNGTKIREYREVKDIVIAETSNYIILTRTYTGKLNQPSLDYADELMYYALNQHLLGNSVEAKASFQKALDMWNGTCFVDEAIKPSSFNGVGAPTDSGYCANNRIGLALFVGKVLRATVPTSLSTVLWQMQLPNGGIASLSQNGKPIGSANCETTSLALLQFDYELVARLTATAI